jgi:outer membrane lipoprotein LolB
VSPAPRRLAAALLLVALGLAGCASVTAPGGAGGDLSGRLAIQVEAAADAPARSVSSAFELRGDALRGSLALSTPLGTTIAQARWSPGEAVLTTPQGQRTFGDLDALTREMLGEVMPVAALFDWLRGRPWAAAPSRPGPEAAGASFEQLGWQVDLSHFAEAWVVARRSLPPAVTVRVRLSSP